MNAKTSREVHSLGAYYIIQPFSDAYRGSGREFLLRWGIHTENKTHISGLLHGVFARTFKLQWDSIMEPELKTKPQNIFAALQKFDKVMKKFKDLMPEQFPKKAAIVYQRLEMFQTIDDAWSELDWEVKIYSIWHLFFSDFNQQA